VRDRKADVLDFPLLADAYPIYGRDQIRIRAHDNRRIVLAVDRADDYVGRQLDIDALFPLPLDLDRFDPEPLNLLEILDAPVDGNLFNSRLQLARLYFPAGFFQYGKERSLSRHRLLAFLIIFPFANGSDIVSLPHRRDRSAVCEKRCERVKVKERLVDSELLQDQVIKIRSIDKDGYSFGHTPALLHINENLHTAVRQAQATFINQYTHSLTYVN